jgi:hypothetical protein
MAYPDRTPNGAGLPRRLQFTNDRVGIGVEETAAFLVTDIEVFTLESWFEAKRAGLDELANRILQVGMDWEHLQAFLPHDPKAIAPADQAELDRLARETIALNAEFEKRMGRDADTPQFQEPRGSNN